jgi:predicted MFS family arabinose efflux permease
MPEYRVIKIYSLDPALHGRINSVYMVTYFLGGSLGSFIGSQAWALAGWPGVCATGILFSAAAFVFLSIQPTHFRTRLCEP